MRCPASEQREDFTTVRVSPRGWVSESTGGNTNVVPSVEGAVDALEVQVHFGMSLEGEEK